MTAQTNSYSPAALHAFNERLIEEFRTNGGTVSGMFSGVPLLLLSTTGAKTGLTRTTPVTYSRDFARLVIIAAKQGSPTHPDWYHNIVANPKVTIEVGGERFPAVARVAAGEERQRLFDQMTSERPNFVDYQSRTSRQLPVIVLERVLDNTVDYNAFNRNLIDEFHARGGKVGGIFEGLPLLLLTTTGAKSGNPRIAPLVYGTDRNRLIVAASKGGSPTNPDWYHNIVASPEVAVDLGIGPFPARATIVEGSERDRLFDELVAVIPKLAETQASTTRQLPVIALKRAG